MFEFLQTRNSGVLNNNENREIVIKRDLPATGHSLFSFKLS